MGMNDKVLLVDDEPKVLAGLRRHLGNKFSLSFASNGGEALALVEREGPFAAIVSDMQMPGMSGLQLLGEMRRRAPETVRMVLSGIADFNAVVAAVNDGAVFRFHTKPVLPEVLETSIATAIVRHEIEKQVHGRIDPSEELLREASEFQIALKEDQLRLYIQPQYRLDGVVAGAEALVRWQHPERGLLLPGQFLGTVEAAGLLGDLTTWMLNATCAEARRLQDLGIPPMHIAVNVTAMDLAKAGFQDRVLLSLERHGVCPSWLELELTEGAALTEIDIVQATLRGLAGHGVRLSIDDFGTGHSSLGWLRQLPVEKLKIDRMFIQDITGDTEARRLLEAIISLAREMGLVVVAEGVETDAQMDMLRQTNCDLIQGFLFARPMPAKEFIARMGHSFNSGSTGQLLP